MGGFGLRILICQTILFCVFVGGCSREFNATQPTDETQTLSEISQLTSGFERAGEAYFSPDMKWIVFQAVPKGETQYQMYVAETKMTVEDVEVDPKNPERGWGLMKVWGIRPPIRITPRNSRNTCGFFSP